jgi:hypothetical protein
MKGADIKQHDFKPAAFFNAHILHLLDYLIALLQYVQQCLTARPIAIKEHRDLAPTTERDLVITGGFSVIISRHATRASIPNRTLR